MSTPALKPICEECEIEPAEVKATVTDLSDTVLDYKLLCLLCAGYDERHFNINVTFGIGRRPKS